MDVLYLLLLIGAAVCFALAAFRAERGGVAVPRVNLVALGLLLWVLVPLLQTLQSLD